MTTSSYRNQHTENGTNWTGWWSDVVRSGHIGMACQLMVATHIIFVIPLFIREVNIVCTQHMHDTRARAPEGTQNTRIRIYVHSPYPYGSPIISSALKPRHFGFCLHEMTHWQIEFDFCCCCMMLLWAFLHLQSYQQMKRQQHEIGRFGHVLATATTQWIRCLFAIDIFNDYN